MPTPTYTPLATITVTSATSSVTFSNISQAYTDLHLSFAITSPTESTIKMYFNGDTSASYQWYEWNTSGYLVSGMQLCKVGPSSNVSGNFVIPQYTFTDRFRNYWGKAGTGGTADTTYLSSCCGAYRSGAAVTSIRLDCSTFAVGSVFTLYGTVR